MSELYHHGIKGMKWGVRRFQNEDGTLTETGKLRYRYQTESEVSERAAGRAAKYASKQLKSMDKVTKMAKKFNAGKKTVDKFMDQRNKFANMSYEKVRSEMTIRDIQFYSTLLSGGTMYLPALLIGNAAIAYNRTRED